MILKFMQLGKNPITGEDNEKDTWELVSKDLQEESNELLEAIQEGKLIHIAEETFDVIQVCIRSLVLLKKNGINLEVENKQHNKKLVKRRWNYLRFIRVFWDK
ncbi:MazG nucleotide pyrophosphohydrolase domain-containing protein [Candidatus Clostridium helianthi]|uniref:MazG nucleotide pyrophosphohydrolase domain-containing protein n=1 Tax=Candidatus Clostridium helianthi TaxID=3381660 RepID=A0ABW8SA02_9CLOT